MTVVARGQRAGKWSELMNPSPSASECMCFPLHCNVQSTEARCSHFQSGCGHFQSGSGEGLWWLLETSGWQQFQRDSQKWWGCRKIFKDREAGGWTDGGGRVYTQDSLDDGLEQWVAAAERRQLCRTKQQVRATESPHSRHPGRAGAE